MSRAELSQRGPGRNQKNKTRFFPQIKKTEKIEREKKRLASLENLWVIMPLVVVEMA